MFLGNLKYISPRQYSFPRMSPLHQSGVALRPWPMPTSLNVSGLHVVARVGECLVHPFDLPEPSRGKSTSGLLDLAALHISLVNHPGPNHELVTRSSHLPFLLSPNFPPLFRLQRVHRYLPVYCSGDMPLPIGSGSSTFL